jgi:hypothetical protein
MNYFCLYLGYDQPVPAKMTKFIRSYVQRESQRFPRTVFHEAEEWFGEFSIIIHTHDPVHFLSLLAISEPQAFIDPTHVQITPSLPPGQLLTYSEEPTDHPALIGVVTGHSRTAVRVEFNNGKSIGYYPDPQKLTPAVVVSQDDRFQVVPRRNLSEYLRNSTAPTVQLSKKLPEPTKQETPPCPVGKFVNDNYDFFWLLAMCLLSLLTGNPLLILVALGSLLLQKWCRF